MKESDGLANAPWYVQFFIRVGVPTGFAAVLLWFLLTNVTATLATNTANQSTIVVNQQKIIELQKNVVHLLQTHDLSSAQSTKFLSAMCYNMAVTADARQRCQDAFLK